MLGSFKRSILTPGHTLVIVSVGAAGSGDGNAKPPGSLPLSPQTAPPRGPRILVYIHDQGGLFRAILQT